MSHAPLLAPERRFGLALGLLLIALAIYRRSSASSRIVSVALLAAGVAFIALTVISGYAVSLVYSAWRRASLVIARVVNPLVLTILFLLLVTPVALLSRVLYGRDELRLKRRNEASYWITRSPPGPTPDSFRNQY